MRIVIVSNKDWHRKYVDEIESRTNSNVMYLSSREEVTREKLTEFKPDWVFSHIGHILFPLKFMKIFVA